MAKNEKQNYMPRTLYIIYGINNVLERNYVGIKIVISVSKSHLVYLMPESETMKLNLISVCSISQRFIKFKSWFLHSIEVFGFVFRAWILVGVWTTKHMLSIPNLGEPMREFHNQFTVPERIWTKIFMETIWTRL